MTDRTKMNREYFEWMCNVIRIHTPRKFIYRKLLWYLHGVDFEYSLPMDGNREADGECLRYRFGFEKHYPECEISELLDVEGCSVLEMMVALALRCEESIMDNPEIGDRTGKWFWTMLDNIGLLNNTDDVFNEEEAERVVSRFLNRHHRRNGVGGLFITQDIKCDMRQLEIWEQMCLYLNENF